MQWYHAPVLRTWPVLCADVRSISGFSDVLTMRRTCAPSGMKAAQALQLQPAELSAVLQALIRKYMPIGVIALIFLFVIWARWFFYGRR